MAKDWEINCYGVTEEEIVQAVERQTDIFGPDFIAISILSDVQELLELGHKEAARQKINVVKFVIRRYLRKETA